MLDVCWEIDYFFFKDKTRISQKAVFCDRTTKWFGKIQTKCGGNKAGHFVAKLGHILTNVPDSCFDNKETNLTKYIFTKSKQIPANVYLPTCHDQEGTTIYTFKRYYMKAF